MKEVSNETKFTIQPIGFVRSSLKRRKDAPRFGNEGAPEAWVEMLPSFVEGLQGIADGLPGLTVGGEIILLTWLHQSRRDVVKVHPRGDENHPLTGVFATRSPIGRIRLGCIALLFLKSPEIV